MENLEKPTKQTIHSIGRPFEKCVLPVSDNRGSAWSVPSWISFVREPALFQRFAALNVDFFQNAQRILVKRLNYHESDMKGSIIDAKWPAKFEKFTQKDRCPSGDMGNYCRKCPNVTELIRTRQRSRRGQTVAIPRATRSCAHTPS